MSIKLSSLLKEMGASAPNPEVQKWLATPVGQKYVQLVKTLVAAEDSMTAFINSHEAGTAMSPNERAEYMSIQKASDSANRNEIAFRKKYVVPASNELGVSWTEFMDAAKQASV